MVIFFVEAEAEAETLLELIGVFFNMVVISSDWILEASYDAIMLLCSSAMILPF
jgi:hypothetical protein